MLFVRGLLDSEGRGVDASGPFFWVLIGRPPDKKTRAENPHTGMRIRTMAELVAIGALDKTNAFVENDITPEQLAQFNITIRHRDSFYREILSPLKKQGRDDLVRTIKKMLAD